jgi:trigger factor
VTVSLLAYDGSELVYDFSDDDGYEMTVGDEEFGSEVDDALIGKNVGDDFTLDATYDMDFDDAALAGHDISYEITINKVQTVTYPELTDTFIQETFGEDTKSDWEETLRQELTASYEADATYDLREQLADQAVANATITGYPKSLYKAKQEELEADYQSYADMFGTTVDDIYEMFGLDEEGRKQEYLDATNREMVLSLIREQEGLTLSDTQYQEKLAEYAEDNEYDSVDELLEEYDEESLKAYFLEELTLDFLEDEADVTVVTE